MRGPKGHLRMMLAVAGTLAVLGTACAKSASPSASGSPTPPPSVAGGGYGGLYGGGSPSSGAASPAVPAGALSQTASLTFSPANITVKSGAKLQVVNTASFTHTFTVLNTSIDVVNEGGKTASVPIGLKPGTYPFICKIHVNQGMKGTLVVTG